uniref:Transposase MuDR plant domain-containing protein n=1 Tax=Brassica oleracea TaxID=3712 RepID=A0A3P6BYE4_BRAOL|nr:unnamed protein product [Brassica oleracea]
MTVFLSSGGRSRLFSLVREQEVKEIWLLHQLFYFVCFICSKLLALYEIEIFSRSVRVEDLPVSSLAAEDLRVNDLLVSRPEKVKYLTQFDYNLMSTESVEITYSLPAEMMQAPNTPPIHVTSDIQVRNLLEITKTHGVRLCVSSRSKVETVSEFREEADEADECFQEDDDDLVEDENHDGEEDDGEEDAGISIVAEADENGEDYSVYGKVEDEDEEDDNMCFEDIKKIEGGRSNGNSIYVNQSFVSKDALLSELRLTAVRFRFSFRIYKSTKTLLVTTCPVSGCQWKVERECETWDKYVLGNKVCGKTYMLDGETDFTKWRHRTRSIFKSAEKIKVPNFESCLPRFYQTKNRIDPNCPLQIPTPPPLSPPHRKLR